MPTNPWRAGNNRGFTLLELLITLAVASILMFGVVPSLTWLITSNTMTARINEFVSQINYARSEAIKRGKRTVVCPSGTPERCESVTDWRGGWMVFVDENANRRRDEPEPVLRVHQSSSDSIALHSTRGRRKIAFRPDGSAAWSNGTYTFCDTSERIAPRAVVISNTGRPRLIKEGSSGQPLLCSS